VSSLLPVNERILPQRGVWRFQHHGPLRRAGAEALLVSPNSRAWFSAGNSQPFVASQTDVEKAHCSEIHTLTLSLLEDQPTAMEASSHP
jgi:hypothetical protein